MGPGAYGHGFGFFHLIFGLFSVLLFLVPAWKIVSKAGFSGAWSLLALIPLVNLIMLWVFAFANWPNVEER